MLLDEDDEIDRNHVATLLQTALDAGSQVAYSQTRLVDATGSLVRIFGGGPFRRELLLRSNFLANNSVLFNSTIIAEGYSIDESFQVFEDWDFWLQVSARHTFAFTGLATAVYRASQGESGAGAGGNLDRALMLSQREKIMRKWGTSH